MLVGCFTLDLYCDDPRHTQASVAGMTQEQYQTYMSNSPGQFTGERRSDCYREARRCGWVIKPLSHKAYCPLHNGKR
jgi:hypothetical protein